MVYVSVCCCAVRASAVVLRTDAWCSHLACCVLLLPHLGQSFCLMRPALCPPPPLPCPARLPALPSSRLVCVCARVVIRARGLPGGTTWQQTPSNMSESAASPEAPLERAPLNLDVSVSGVAHCIPIDSLVHCGSLHPSDFAIVRHNEQEGTLDNRVNYRETT